MLPGPAAAHVRGRLHLDPEADAFLAELDEVQRMLGRLSPDHARNRGRGDDLPAQLSSRIDEMLAEAVREREAAPSRHRRSLGRGSYRYLGAAVACAAAATGLLVLSPRIVDLISTSGDAVSPPGAATTGPWGFEEREPRPGQPGAGVLAGEQLRECLDAAGLPGSVEAIGVEPVSSGDGSPARFRILVPAPSGAGILVLTVGNGCAPDGQGILGRQGIGVPGE
ncbi:hypothetical protein [Lolliginicoccus suaedae]|uniref:hypothetical protein n=1 Tax=Lolliginicoccus suaedae TaxID=2605429 RepID=UPI0011EF62E7|nr:hypothetical protein [Lolliginicoccus suaedae]